MKTKSIFTGFIAAFICMSLNAQVFVGGGISANMHTTKYDVGSSNSETIKYHSIGLSPTIGKFLTDKLAIGIEIDLGFDREKTVDVIEIIDKSFGIGIDPFIRYYALKWNKFTVFGVGNMLFHYSTSSTETGGVKTNAPKNTNLSLYFYPGLSYDITEKLSLETGLNFLNFGGTFNQQKSADATNRTSGFYFGAGLSNIKTLGDISVGAIYKF
jgi:outer membrane protein